MVLSELLEFLGKHAIQMKCLELQFAATKLSEAREM